MKALLVGVVSLAVAQAAICLYSLLGWRTMYFYNPMDYRGDLIFWPVHGAALAVIFAVASVGVRRGLPAWLTTLLVALLGTALVPVLVAAVLVVLTGEVFYLQFFSESVFTRGMIVANYASSFAMGVVAVMLRSRGRQGREGVTDQNRYPSPGAGEYAGRYAQSGRAGSGSFRGRLY